MDSDGKQDADILGNMMTNKIRSIGWMWQYNFMRPLFWKEYQYWLYNTLPFGWSIIREPEENADETDYQKMITYQMVGQ